MGYLLKMVYMLVTIVGIQGVAVNFVPSPNITVHQTAVYHCWVDSNSVSIQWQIDSTPSTDSSVTSLGVVTSGAATQNSSVHIPGSSYGLNVTVTCIASGLVYGDPYFYSNTSTLYVQGKPSAVVELTCVQTNSDLKMFRCDWSDPPTVVGIDITEYTVNITQHGDLITSLSLLTTHFTHNATDIGAYNVTVLAMIGDDLTGADDTTEVVITDKEGDGLVSSVLPNKTTIITSSIGGLGSSKNAVSTTSTTPPQLMTPVLTTVTLVSVADEVRSTTQSARHEEKQLNGISDTERSLYISVIAVVVLVCALLLIFLLIAVFVIIRGNRAKCCSAPIQECVKEVKVQNRNKYCSTSTIKEIQITHIDSAIPVNFNPCYEEFIVSSSSRRTS